VVLTPTADAYIKNSTVATNYGTATSLLVNNANGIRLSFIRFDLSAITGPVTGLKLALPVASAASGQEFNVYGLVSGESWTETGLTWNNAPAVVTTMVASSGTLADFIKTSDLYATGTILSSFVTGAAGTIDTAFDATTGDVLNFVNQDADQVVTFVIAESGASDVSGVGWNSSEVSASPPTLTVITTDTAPVSAEITFLRVVLLGGQSNADGRADGSALPTAPVNYQDVQANVPFYYYTYGSATNADGTRGNLTTLRRGATQFPTGGVGPEIGLGYHLSRVFQQQSGSALAIIKYAKGGSSLNTDWKAGGDETTVGDGVHYTTFQQVVANGLAKLRAAYPRATVQVTGMAWVQGETDIDNGSATASAYGQNLTAFIADVRATFGAHIPFFFSRISSSQSVYSNPAAPDYSKYLLLRAGQESVAATVDGAYLIDTDSPAFTTNSDFLHFDAAGQLALGTALAAKMADVLFLRISGITRIGSGQQLNWNSIPGKFYHIDTSPDLITWTTQAVGAVCQWIDPLPLPARRFYKISEDF